MNNKRNTLKKVAGVSAAVALAPTSWTKPALNAVVLPAHAQTSTSASLIAPFFYDCVNEALVFNNAPFSDDFGDFIIRDLGEASNPTFDLITSQPVSSPATAIRISGIVNNIGIVTIAVSVDGAFFPRLLDISLDCVDLGPSNGTLDDDVSIVSNTLSSTEFVSDSGLRYSGSVSVSSRMPNGLFFELGFTVS